MSTLSLILLETLSAFLKLFGEFIVPMEFRIESQMMTKHVQDFFVRKRCYENNTCKGRGMWVYSSVETRVSRTSLQVHFSFVCSCRTSHSNLIGSLWYQLLRKLHKYPDIILVRAWNSNGNKTWTTFLCIIFRDI